MIGRPRGRWSAFLSYVWIALGWLVVAAATVAPCRAETPLLLNGGERSLPLTLELRLGDRSVDEAWDAAFDALGRYFDRNGDGGLDREEAARLPSPFGLRQTLWGQFALEFEIGRTPLQVKEGTRASFADLAAHYRKHGIGNAVVARGQVELAKALNEALVRQLDLDRNGSIGESELHAAAKTLAPLDLNDDELIGPGELDRAVTSYPGTQGTVLVAAKPTRWAADASHPVFQLPAGSASRAMYELLKPRTTKIELPLGDIARDAAKPDAAQHDTAKPDAAPSGWQTFSIDGLTLHLRPERGTLPARIAEIGIVAETWFKKYDADRDGTITPAEAEGLQRAAFERYLAVTDRDGDKKLTHAEYVEWIELQTRIAAAQALVTVIDFEHGLFEQLDADHDGGLSVRELRTAAARLKEAGLLVDSPSGRSVDMDRLPRVLLATVSRGHPTSLLVAGARRGPSWFCGMDRNGDGDVSEREWLLPIEEFKQLDGDRDGLMSAEEAAKSSPLSDRERRN